MAGDLRKKEHKKCKFYLSLKHKDFLFKGFFALIFFLNIPLFTHPFKGSKFTSILIASYRPPEPPRCTCSQESSTGGGMAVLTVDVLMSPMMLRASRRAWYIRSISSRCWACS